MKTSESAGFYRISDQYGVVHLATALMQPGTMLCGYSERHITDPIGMMLHPGALWLYGGVMCRRCAVAVGAPV